MRISFDQANVPQFAPTRETRELALAAIKEAYAQIGQSQQVDAVSPLQEVSKQKSKATPGLFKRTQPLGLAFKSTASLLGLMGIGAVIIVWQSNLGRAAPEPPTASIANTKNNQPATVSSEKLDTAVAQAKPAVLESQTTPRNTPSDSTAGASSPDLARQLQSIARDLSS